MEETKKNNEEIEQTIDTSNESMENNNNDFLSGVSQSGFSAEDELEDLKKPKEDYTSNFEDQEETSDLEDDLDDFMDEKPKSNKNAKTNASLITMWFDNIFSWVLAWWSGNIDNFTTFQAEKKNLKIIEESIERGLVQTGKDFEMPWWYGLFIQVPIAYMAKIRLSFKIRKENRQKETLKRKAEAKHKANAKPNVRAFKEAKKKAENEERTNVNRTVNKSTLVNHNHPNRVCGVCDKQLTKNQSLFCSRKCSAIDLNARKKAEKEAQNEES